MRLVVEGDPLEIPGLKITLPPIIIWFFRWKMGVYHVSPIVGSSFLSFNLGVGFFPRKNHDYGEEGCKKKHRKLVTSSCASPIPITYTSIT